MSNSPSMSGVDELLSIAGQMADAAGSVLLKHFRAGDLRIDNKSSSGFDPVTEADREAELAMREVIARLRHEDGIIGEEFENTEGSSGLTWVLDPIDGTRSFITGIPLWTTLIGLRCGKQPILGIIDQPFLGERYWGITGDGRREAGVVDRKGRRGVRARSCSSLATAHLCTTHPEAFASQDDYGAFLALGERCRMTRYGGDAYQYALLATGMLDLIVESGLKLYDLLAVIPIVEGAGGRITDWSGNPCGEGGRVLAVGDAGRQGDAIRLLERNAPR